MNRRNFLLQGAALTVGLSIPGAAMAVGSPHPSRPESRLDQLVSVINPELRMVNANTGEKMSGRFFTETGYDENIVDRINWFARDWREEKTRQMDVRILWALAAIRQAAMKEGFNGEIRFLSGFRTEKTNELLRQQGYNASRNSFHIKARAIDFSLPGVSVEAVYKYAEWLQVGGVGYYPGSFVHIDSGDRRTWRG